MPLPFDMHGFRAAKDKSAWYREQGWKHLKRAVELHQSAAAAGDRGAGPSMARDADEYRRTAEAMFKRAEELDPK